MEKLLFINDSSSESESDDEFEDEIINLIAKVSKKSPKSFYLRKRPTHGEFILNREFSEEKFRNYYRLNREQFNEVHHMIKDEITAEGCNASRPIGTDQKVAVFLRYLASGDSFKSIGYSYRMSDRTVSNIVKEVSAAIWKCMQPIYMPEPTTQHWESTARGFEQRWHFPHCIGAIDGKHVVIKKPGKSGSSYFNYKHTFSVVLMAVVDSNYQFIFIDVGSMGRFSDGNIFASSILAKKMKKNALNLPPPYLIPTIDELMPYVFVADEAFPLSENVMRPYPKRSVSGNFDNKVFNYRLSRARQTVECSFGILASRFRVFQSPFECKVNTVIKIVKASCILHNYLRTSAISHTGDDLLTEVVTPQNQLRPMQQTRSRSASQAFFIRQKFTEYFNSISGSVPWQRDCVLRGRY